MRRFAEFKLVEAGFESEATQSNMPAAGSLRRARRARLLTQEFITETYKFNAYAGREAARVGLPRQRAACGGDVGSKG